MNIRYPIYEGVYRILTVNGRLPSPFTALVLATLNLPLPGSSAAPIFHAVPGSVPAAVPLQRR
jgi:hypothetical protein